MNERPRQITLGQWEQRYTALQAQGMREPWYGGPLARHVEDGDLRLLELKFDNSPAALRLWNFLLTEEERLEQARQEGKKIVGTMKDLGTVPVLAYAFDNLVGFYPDGAWWIPCVMELSEGLFGVADSLGIGESFCPVRAMLGAFVTRARFPIPDHLVCSIGATCDDFSAIAQRLNGLGYPILWWEIPHRRRPEGDEGGVELPGGLYAPRTQVDFVEGELRRVKESLEELAGQRLEDEKLSAGIRKANRVRALLGELRTLTFTAKVCPLPALEMLIAEMLALHFCSDIDEAIRVLEELLSEVRRRVKGGLGVLDARAAKLHWVNPVADLRVMNVVEECGGRICGTEYLLSHALDAIPQDIPPIEALAKMALADPMVGSARERAARVCSDAARYDSEAVVISRIPGASHCALEGKIIGEYVHRNTDLPVLEMEVPCISDPMLPSLRTRLEALIESAKERRRK